MASEWGFISALPHWAIMLPFCLLLIAIALGPIVAQHHWERHYHRLCLLLAAIVCGYYLFAIRQPGRVLHALFDYLNFMVVVGSAFVVAGGIHLRVKGPSGPVGNTLFLFFGAVIANLVGTIAASVLLIRPWLTMNKGRAAPMHVAFFIFIISNIGGALLPVGPPLVLGYLKGVPFNWTFLHCWPQWLVIVSLVLVVFLICDSINIRGRGRTAVQPDLTSWRCEGGYNFVFLLIILVALTAAPAGWRAFLVGLAAVGSYVRTPNKIRESNEFSFSPLIEIGWLFLGIFGTMIPVLEFMEGSAGKLGLHSNMQLYWATGLLSALLDNAPTYLAFFATALGLHGLDIDQPSQIAAFLKSNGNQLAAISLGAAFFGALTYIGNAPNLLVKTIAEHAGVPTPTFVAYIVRFALPILLPILTLIAFLFFS